MPNAHGHLPPHTEHLLRDLAPQVLGVLARRTGDFASAEDAVQEALIAAAGRWPGDGVPDNPRGWLIQAAHRRWTDQVRSESARRRREEAAALRDPPPPDAAVPGEDAADRGHTGHREDDELTLVFLCCHPSLSQASAIALTLRAVGGLTTAEIASAFLVPEATMAQRISRAKQQVKKAGATFRLPPPEERAELLRSVRHVLYLMFNEGYTASSGSDLHRVDLSDEAIRLARLLYRAVPGDAETAGLLALMLLTDARRAARTTPDGRPIPLDEQDRTAWDRERIAEGKELLAGAIARREVGEYQLQAAISEVHDDAPAAEATDWPRILALYGLLEQMTGNPVVTLNRAVAAAMARGPAEGLAVLESAAPALKGHHHVDAVRAYLLELSGDRAAAADCYAAAAARATSVPERDHLTKKAAGLRQERG
ncbi:MAG TPA: sigma-70 family RNA polymerase sigma factor [Trebonia sp.]